MQAAVSVVQTGHSSNTSVQVCCLTVDQETCTEDGLRLPASIRNIIPPGQAFDRFVSATTFIFPVPGRTEDCKPYTVSKILKFECSP